MLKASPQDIAVVRSVVDFYRRIGKLPPAEALLRKILDGKMQAKRRRHGLGPTGTRHDSWRPRQYPDLQKAVNLVEQNLAGPQASVADRQLLAKLKAADPRRGERDKAIEILESLRCVRHAGRPLGSGQNVPERGKLDRSQRLASRSCRVQRQRIAVPGVLHRCLVEAQRNVQRGNISAIAWRSLPPTGSAPSA